MRPRLSAIALLALFAAACAAAPAPATAPAATLPAGFDSLATLARQFAPPDGEEQRVTEASDAYEISLTTNLSIENLEALWSEAAANTGIEIGAKVRSPELFQVTLEDFGVLSATPRPDGALDVRISLALGE